MDGFPVGGLLSVLVVCVARSLRISTWRASTHSLSVPCGCASRGKPHERQRPRGPAVR